SQLIHDALAKKPAPHPHEEQRLARMIAALPPEPGALSGRYRGKNVLVLQVESLQNFVIGRTVNGVPITPNLNRLVSQSLYFPHFYHETGAGHTADAEFLTQSALYGEAQGIAYSDLTNEHMRALPSILDDAGYTTFSMHGNNGAFYNRATMHPRLGFEHTYFRERLNSHDLIGWGLSDKSFLAQGIDKAAAAREPFYGFLITLSSHYPFDWGYPTTHPLPLGAWDGTPLGKYLTAIHYTDEALGEFVSGLERRGLLRSTIVVMYGDHNAVPRQGFDELESFLKADQQPDSWALQQRVPLIIHLPDGRSGRIDKVGGEVDVAPTLADLLGVNAPILRVAGHNLLAPGPGRAIFRDGTWVNQQVICLHTLTAAREPYDLKTGEPLPYERVAAEDADAQHVLAVSDAIVNGDLSARVASDVRRLSARLRTPAVRLASATRSR
ncbi:MAG TPA: LTA synthase family protein, partial [Oscillatoriaceae cyanobacterium]